MDTRDKIIEQTFILLLDKGYDGVSISNIQSALGISRGLLYHYFGSKEALFFETIKHNFITNFKVDLELIGSYNIDQMAQYMVEKHQILLRDVLRGAPIIKYDFLCYRAMQQSGSLAALYRRVRDDELHGWLLALNNSRQCGMLNPGFELSVLARQFVYAVDGVWFSAVSPAGDADLITALREALETLCRLIKK